MTDFANFILVDRSGSMETRWEETMSSLSALVKGLVDGGQPEAEVTVALFDAHQGFQFQVIRDAVKAREFKDIQPTEASPRGYTPLLDACVRVAALAEMRNAERTAIMVLTDGEENHSKEATKEGARAAFDRLRAKGWVISFMGADFDAFAEAGAVGVGRAGTVMTSAMAMASATRLYAGKAARYGASGQSAEMDWTDAEREEAMKPKETK